MPLGYFTDSTPLTPLRDPFNVLVDAVNANETAIGNRQIQTFRWANATERGAQVGMQAGDVGYQSDDTTYYRYNGSAWKAWRSGRITRTGTILNNVTVGSGTLISYYQYLDGEIREWGKFTLGTGSAVSGTVEFSTVATMDTSLYSGHRIDLGTITVEDVGSASYNGRAAAVSATRAGFFVSNVASTYDTQVAVNGSTPMSWSTANGDTISWNLTYTPA